MRVSIFLFTCCLLSCISLRGEWAEKILKEMTVEEKIGQLFVLPACPNREGDHTQDLVRLFRDYHVGGLIMKHAHPKEQVLFLNHLQSLSKHPLLVTADAEWGLGMRMKEGVSFPRNLTLGAIQDPTLLYELGYTIGDQCKKVGIHLNFAPVVDVNNNPANPIIHTRSFGEDPKRVSKSVEVVTLGMQEAGILACAKHFPGHGDVSVDSHKALPFIPHPKEHLEAIEFVPFKKALKSSIGAVMSGHLYLPACDKTFPSSLSSKLVTDLLKKSWGFEGLIVTDALNMKALTEHYSAEEIPLQAFLAGHDLLLYGAHRQNDVDEILHELFPRAFASLKKAVLDGLVSQERLDASVLKILRTKEKLGLPKMRFTLLDSDLMEVLHAPSVYELKKRLFAEAVTLYSEAELKLPLSQKEDDAYLQIGGNELSSFYDQLSSKVAVTPFIFNPDMQEELLEILESFDTVIVGIYDVKGKIEESFGLSEEKQSFLRLLKEKHPQVAYILFGTPYAAGLLPSDATVLIGYEEAKECEEAVSEILFGESEIKGKLPVTVVSPINDPKD